MKNSMRGFIDPYGLGFIVVVFGAFFFDIEDSFESHDQVQTKQQYSEQQQGVENADTK